MVSKLSKMIRNRSLYFHVNEKFSFWKRFQVASFVEISTECNLFRHPQCDYILFLLNLRTNFTWLSDSRFRDWLISEKIANQIAVAALDATTLRIEVAVI